MPPDIYEPEASIVGEPALDGRDLTRRLMIRDLVIPAEIGVYGHEHGRRQRVRINLTADVLETGAPVQDRLAEVLDYDELVNIARREVNAGRINLCETLAERMARAILSLAGVTSCRVRVEKLDVYDDIAAVGVEIVRRRHRP
jgi:7,8-dihydroneopterin aldolase/epimerase/oxygenase